MNERQSVAFRPARSGDGAVIARLRHDAWEATYRGIYPDDMIDRFDYAWHTERSESTLRDPAYTTHIIELNGMPMGYLIWRIDVPPRYKDFAFCLQSLYLLPDLQGHGVGRSAIAMARQACLRAGYDRLYWQCQPENARAMAFYQHLGAVIAQRDEGHLNRNENSVTFEWRLSCKGACTHDAR